jgi:predicted transcriptional regulator
MLGDLEHRVLEAVWSAKRPLTARGIHERVARTHDVVYITCTWSTVNCSISNCSPQYAQR